MAGGFLTYLLNKINEKLHEIYPGAGVTRTEKSDFAAVDTHIEHLVIPDGTEKIPREAFKGYRKLVSVSVPSSVREIGEFAFADCEKLERVTLHEGLVSVENDVFNGCCCLKSIVIPDSVKKINGAAFRSSGLTEPVLSTSGETFFYCPAAAAGNEYKIPDGVRRIGRCAFNELHDLNRIHFPKSLERIDRMAFVKCGIESVTLPRWFEKLEKNAFYECDALRSLSFEEGFDPVRAAVVRMNFNGVSFLVPAWFRLKQSDSYWEGADFLALAEKCASGSWKAMEQMADFFEKKSAAAPDEPFYTGAMNFWGYRAYENGSSIWKKRLEDYIKSVPDKRLPSAWLDENLHGLADGKMLNAMGFMFFDPSRGYNLDGLDDDGVVEVSSYESEDGPDEDGFGMETYYDWWYLDCNLCPVPGADCLHSCSNIDRRIENVQNRFNKAHDTVAAAVMKECFRRGAALEQEGLLEEAFYLYKRAADSGSGDAMYAIGNLYYRKNFRSFKNILVGLLMPWDDIPDIPDTSSAFRWFMKAANAGIPDAMVNVGIMLSSGTGCKKNGDMSREWLEKAADTGNQYAKKALHDFFDIPITDAMADDAYDQMTDDFCALAEASDTKAAILFENLMNGTDEQLSRLGLRLAEGRYGKGGSYWDYAYPNLNKDRSCAPVVTIRCGWASAIVVNLRAFPDEGSILTFASGIGQDLVPVFGIRESGEQIEYDAVEFGWLKHRRHAQILRTAPGYFNEKVSEELKYCGVDVPELLEYLKLTEHDALFIENGEKEYSVEIGHLVGDELRILLRYTVDGWDQGNGPAKTVLLSKL